jgi:hypothetical protein
MASQSSNDNQQIEQKNEQIQTNLSQWNTHISNNTEQGGLTIGQQLGHHMAYQNNKSNEPPVGIKMDFKFPSGSTIPIPTAHPNPNPMVFGCLGPPRIERHPETGRPINQPSLGQNDKKKLVASLYTELSNIRSQIEKLNKSTDMIYEILRDI